MNNDLEVVKQLSGFQDCPNLVLDQIALEGLSLKPGTELVFFAEPADYRYGQQDDDDLLLQFLEAASAEQDYSKIVSSDKIHQMPDSVEFIPRDLKLAILLTNDKNDLDIEFCQDFPTDRNIPNNLVVPLKLLLHPLDVTEILIKILSGTLCPHVRFRADYEGSVCKLQLQVGSHQSTRWLLTEQLEDYFEIEALGITP